MNFEDIRPFVRSVRYVNKSSWEEEDYICSYDQTLIFVLDGKGKIVFKDRVYSVCRGCVLIFKAGIPYKVLWENERLVFLLVNFDYTKQHSISKRYPLLPVVFSEFHPDKILSNIDFLDNKNFNNTVFSDDMTFVENRLRALYTEFQQREHYYESKLSCELFSILIDVSRVNSETDNVKCKRTGDARDIVNFIHQHYNEELNNEMLGKKFNFTSKYINELVKKQTGYSIHKYITICRISRAIDYLQNTDMRISEISMETGFSDISHFSKYFKQIIGVNPKVYRAKKKSL